MPMKRATRSGKNGPEPVDVEVRRRSMRRLVEEAVQTPTNFVQDVLSDTGDCINRSAVRHKGQSQVLHSWWQPERVIDHLSKEECKELAVAGFRIQQDPSSIGDHYVYLRYRRHHHLWLAHTTGGWGFSRAVNLKDCQWEPLVPNHRALPIWEGWSSDVRSSIRESAAVAVQALRSMGYPQPVIPDKVFSENFFKGLKTLAEDVAVALEEDAGKLREFVDQLPVEVGERYEVTTDLGEIPIRLGG